MPGHGRIRADLNGPARVPCGLFKPALNHHPIAMPESGLFVRGGPDDYPVVFRYLHDCSPLPPELPANGCTPVQQQRLYFFATKIVGRPWATFLQWTAAWHSGYASRDPIGSVHGGAGRLFSIRFSVIDPPVSAVVITVRRRARIRSHRPWHFSGLFTGYFSSGYFFGTTSDVRGSPNSGHRRDGGKEVISIIFPFY
jgi:hypothetical protein